MERRDFCSFGYFLVCIAILAVMPSRASADTVLSVSAPASVTQGGVFAVDVNISGVADLYDFQFDLGFSPGVVSVVGLAEGGFLNGGNPSTTFFVPGAIDNTVGAVTSTADTLLGPVPGVSGMGTLVVFNFMALSPGTSALTITNVIMQDPNGALLGSTTTGGSVTVQHGVVGVAEPSELILLGCGSFALFLLGRLRI
jgi:general secretion pathway protein D